MGEKKKSSQYRGVYFDTATGKWIVYLESHEHHPGFNVERDAGIYAEYHLRKLYGITPNFPNIDDDLLNRMFELVTAMHEIVKAENRSKRLQGVKIKKKGKTTSKYVGVFKKSDTRWAARIQYRGKSIHLGHFSANDLEGEKKAAIAYDKKALELYGKSARLNFPEQGM